MENYINSYETVFEDNEKSLKQQISELFNSDSENIDNNIHFERLKYLCSALIFKSNNFKEFYQVFDYLSENIFDSNIDIDVVLKDTISSIDTIHEEISCCIDGIESCNYINISDDKVVSINSLNIDFGDYFIFRINNHIDTGNKNIDLFLLDILKDIELKLKMLIDLKQIVGKYYINNLTGIGNRTYVDSLVVDLFNMEEDLSFFYIDINNFKSVNDTYGHFNGDLILKDFSLLLKNELQRYSGVPGNYGGDEFVGLLPGVDEFKSKDIAKTIIDKFRQNSYMYRDENGKYIFFSVTVSIGISTRKKGKYNGLTAIDYLKGADRALEEAKKGNKYNGALFHIGDNISNKKSKEHKTVTEPCHIERVNQLKLIIKNLSENILGGKHPGELGIIYSDLPIIKDLVNYKIYKILVKKFDI